MPVSAFPPDIVAIYVSLIVLIDIYHSNESRTVEL